MIDLPLIGEAVVVTITGRGWTTQPRSVLHTVTDRITNSHLVGIHIERAIERYAVDIVTAPVVVGGIRNISR